GGGRYLFDTVKNTDGLVLEMTAGSPDLTIDFNFAYNPSCAYDARWACPLAPRENWLPVPVRAGEKVFSCARTPSSAAPRAGSATNWPCCLRETASTSSWLRAARTSSTIWPAHW